MLSFSFTEIVIGFRTKDPRISFTLGGIVEEKKSDWRVWGRHEIKYLISAINPMSTILSASSITILLNSEIGSARLSINSLKRPGVPITKLGMHDNSYLCFLSFIPPTQSAFLIPKP